MYRDSGPAFSFTITPVVKKLLLVNAVVFGFTLLAGPSFTYEWLAFRADHPLTRFWGAFTYMFVHGGFWHLFMNMLVLFFFGPPLEARWGGREFLRFYLVAGLGGAALGLLLANGPMVGASAAVYGVMLAFAMNWPNAPIYVWGIFPVKAKWLVGVFFVLALVGTFDPGGSRTAHFAHLGGLIAALLYLKADWRPGGARRGTRPSARRSPRPLAIVPRELTRTRSDAAEPAERETADERGLLDEVDRVLDKISAQGMGSLSAEERALLDEVSRRRRTN
ncbi:rhomboid family intramembrane serine protease [Gemmatimonadota bacterium Y43]|uniref:rhomboid family intramembrane serine protease n=1 Tax=Gaopeijia maritima TaxID=3119007 RepID=UPI0032794456